jgi:hypothetical protein
VAGTFEVYSCFPLLPATVELEAVYWQLGLQRVAVLVRQLR